MSISNQFPTPPYITDKDKLNHYIIVDCAHFDHKLYREIRKNQNLQSKSLFMDTPDEESAFAGPVLITLDFEKNWKFIQEIQEIEQKQPAILWLWSNQNFNQLFDILQSIQYGKLDNGKTVLCRYFDPRCTEVMLKMLATDQDVAQQIQKITAWAYKQTGGQYKYITEI